MHVDCICLQGFVHLRTLILQKCKIRCRPGFAQLLQMPHLSALRLISCRFAQAPKQPICLPDTLTSLMLKDSMIEASLADMARLPELAVLSLISMSLDSFDVAALAPGAFRALTMLDLSKNIFTCVPEGLQPLSKLAKLSMTMQQKDFQVPAPLTALIAMTSLVELHVWQSMHSHIQGHAWNSLSFMYLADAAFRRNVGGAPLQVSAYSKPAQDDSNKL